MGQNIPLSNNNITDFEYEYEYIGDMGLESCKVLAQSVSQSVRLGSVMREMCGLVTEFVMPPGTKKKIDPNWQQNQSSATLGSGFISINPPGFDDTE